MQSHLLAQLLSRSPLWAIRPEAALLAVQRAAAETEWVCAKPTTYSLGRNAGKLSVIPIEGVLTKDGPAWYGSNYQTIQAAAERAMSDPDVKMVTLQVDSPGGEVTGLPETAAALAALAKVKPVHAMVEGDAASAAYWLTSQASDITLTPSGEVGSVGVRMMHVDVSKAMEDSGFKITELYSGDHKTEWSPYKPLAEEAVANMQPRLEATHRQFIAAVTAGRGGRASAEARASRYGEGRMFDAPEALSRGMVDRVLDNSGFYKTIMPPSEESSSTIKMARARVEIARASGFF